MKIVHWEYNSELDESENTGEPKLAIGATRNIHDNRPTGVYFRWTYFLQNNATTYLHCVAEDSYKINDLKDFSLLDLKMLLYNSFENFKAIFLERLDIIDVHVSPPIFEIHDETLQSFLNELQN